MSFFVFAGGDVQIEGLEWTIMTVLMRRFLSQNLNKRLLTARNQ